MASSLSTLLAAGRRTRALLTKQQSPLNFYKWIWAACAFAQAALKLLASSCSYLPDQFGEAEAADQDQPGDGSPEPDDVEDFLHQAASVGA